MRHNDARKWLHAALDLLPVLLIPVFMIYSHRHVMTQQTTVDIQYKYQSNEVNSLDDLVTGNIYYNSYLPIYDDSIGDFDFTIDILHYELETNDDVSLDEYNDIPLIYNGSHCQLSASKSNNNYAYYLFFYSSLDEDTYISYSIDSGLSFYNIIYQVDDVDDFSNYLNLQILGEYDTRITLPEYIDYNVIESVDVHDETSSVMNVFMDNFNGAVDKYFNMGNVFNLNGVYQWFNTNIFGGNAPQIIYSVWNIVLYEFVMDLLFLLYGLFMWFIDMMKHLMEKPFRSIK